jgi:hypothetical protein
MSKIAEQIQKLKEQEKRLERETRKVEFFNHILTSAREYNHASFSDVKDDVVTLLDQFVKKTIEAIEAGTEVTITVGPAVVSSQPSVDSAQKSISTPPKKPEDRVGANDKLSFALDNRHLSGKIVTVANDKNMTITGKVVGLDAPYVLVATETGPTIKVPLEKVSLR